MEALKYKVIKSGEQYDEYCQLLEQLAFQENTTPEVEEDIELLTVLIEKYDQEYNTFEEVDPITMLKSLMEDHNLKAKDLVNILGVSKGLVSDILNYKKGLSKEVIRKLSEHFSMNQEAFNRPYKLKVDSKLRNAGVMNTRKKLEVT